jgi:hypothetical protein
MANSEASGASGRLKKIRKQVESSLHDAFRQAKKAEEQITRIGERLAKIDKSAARAEVEKVSEKLQGEIGRLSRELMTRGETFRTEIEKNRSKVEDAVRSLKAQVKAVAEAEKTKRRGRRRSK